MNTEFDDAVKRYTSVLEGESLKSMFRLVDYPQHVRICINNYLAYQLGATLLLIVEDYKQQGVKIPSKAFFAMTMGSAYSYDLEGNPSKSTYTGCITPKELDSIIFLLKWRKEHCLSRGLRNVESCFNPISFKAICTILKEAKHFRRLLIAMR